MALPILKIMLFKFISENEKITGYDFLKFCKEKGIKASSGSVYPHLKEFESKGLITKIKQGRKNYYSLTKEGKEYSKTMQDYKDKTKKILTKLGVEFEENNKQIPKELNDKFRLLYLKFHSTKWKNKKSVKNILEIIEDIEKMLRRQIDGESD